MSPRTAIRIDTGVALFYAALSTCLIYISIAAAEDAVRRYGRNVDSGALEWFVAVTYFAPVALLFALAALSFWRGWQIARYVHWFAVVCAVGPLALEVMRSVSH